MRRDKPNAHERTFLLSVRHFGTPTVPFSLNARVPEDRQRSMTYSQCQKAVRRQLTTGETVFPSDRAAYLATSVLVEAIGIEPTTSCLQSRCSPN